MVYSTSEIQQQNQVALQALQQGKITPTQYNQFMAFQNQEFQKAQQLEAQTHDVYTYHDPENPLRKKVIVGPPSSAPRVQEINPFDETQSPEVRAYAEAQIQQERSVNFYVASGHPEYAGKYAAPTVPKGTTVKSIKETPSGLQMELQTPYESAMEKYEKEPVYSAKVIANRGAGTRTDSMNKGIGYNETPQGAKQINWSNYTPEEQEALRGYLQGENVKKVTNLGLFVAAPIAVVAAPKIALIGAGVNVALSQGVKGVQGGGLLSLEELGVAAGQGAVFSVVAGGVMSQASKAVPILGAKSVGGAVARVGVATATGTVVGGVGGGTQAYLLGEDVGEGAKSGAIVGGGVGFGFGVASEVGGYAYGKFVKPRIESNLAQSYGKTLETGEMWKPTSKERIIMKLSGATPKSPELNAKVAEQLNASYKAQYELNEAILMDKPLPANIEGRTGMQTWAPTAKEAEMIRTTGITPKIPAESVNVARVAGGDALSYSGLKRSITADDLFDFSVSPKSSLRMEIVQPQVEATQVVSPTTRTLFWRAGAGVIIDKEFRSELQKAEMNVESKQRLTEAKLPENQLAYDYRDVRGFKDPAFKYAEGKEVTYKPTPTGRQKSSNVGMKPLWESVGNKPSAPIIESRQGPISNFAVQKEVNRTPTIESGVKPRNPFTMSRNAVVEEYDLEYLSYPNSPLPSPPKTQMIEKVTQRQSPQMFTMPSVPQATKAKKPSVSEIAKLRGFADVAVNPSFDVDLRRGVKQEVAPVLALGTVQAPSLMQTPKLEEPTVTPPPTNIPSFSGSPLLDLPRGGGALGGGGGEGSFGFEGLSSKRKKYPIFSAEELLKRRRRR